MYCFGAWVSIYDDELEVASVCASKGEEPK